MFVVETWEYRYASMALKSCCVDESEASSGTCSRKYGPWPRTSASSDNFLYLQISRLGPDLLTLHFNKALRWFLCMLKCEPCCVLPFIRNVQKKIQVDGDSKLMVVGDRGWEWEWTVKGHEGSYWGDENAVTLIYSDSGTNW